MNTETISYSQAINTVRDHCHELGISSSLNILELEEILDYADTTLGSYVSYDDIEYFERGKSIRTHFPILYDQPCYNWIDHLHIGIAALTGYRKQQDLEKEFNYDLNEDDIKSILATCEKYRSYAHKLHQESDTKISRETEESLQIIEDRLKRILENPASESITPEILIILIKLFDKKIGYPKQRQVLNYPEDSIEESLEKCKSSRIFLPPKVLEYLDRINSILTKWEKEYCDYKKKNQFYDMRDIQKLYMNCSQLKNSNNSDDYTFQFQATKTAPNFNNLLEYREVQLVLSMLKFIDIKNQNEKNQNEKNQNEKNQKVENLLKFEIYHLLYDTSTENIIEACHNLQTDKFDISHQEIIDLPSKYRMKKINDMVPDLIKDFKIRDLCQTWGKCDKRNAHLDTLIKASKVHTNQASKKGYNEEIRDFLRYMYGL